MDRRKLFLHSEGLDLGRMYLLDDYHYAQLLSNPPESLEQLREVLLEHVLSSTERRRALGQTESPMTYSPDFSDPINNDLWPPQTIKTADLEAVVGPGVAIQDVPLNKRNKLVAYAAARGSMHLYKKFYEVANCNSHERWRRRQFYTDEEEGGEAPANWKDEEEIPTGDVPKAEDDIPHRPILSPRSRSSSKVRFAEDTDDFDTRSNPSTSSRSIPERWGGIDIPDAERDAGKDILYQVTQQAFNQMLDLLFKKAEDKAIAALTSGKTRKQHRHLFENEYFEKWALTVDEMRKKKFGKKKDDVYKLKESPSEADIEEIWHSLDTLREDVRRDTAEHMARVESAVGGGQTDGAADIAEEVRSLRDVPVEELLSQAGYSIAPDHNDTTPAGPNRSAVDPRIPSAELMASMRTFDPSLVMSSDEARYALSSNEPTDSFRQSLIDTLRGGSTNGNLDSIPRSMLGVAASTAPAEDESCLCQDIVYWHNSSDEDSEDVLVEEILSERYCKHKDTKKYLVKWAGMPVTKASWETEESLQEDGGDVQALKDWKEQAPLRKAGIIRAFDLKQWRAEREDLIKDEVDDEANKDSDEPSVQEVEYRDPTMPQFRPNAAPPPAPTPPIVTGNHVQNGLLSTNGRAGLLSRPEGYEMSFPYSGLITYQPSIPLPLDLPRMRIGPNGDLVSPSNDTSASASPVYDYRPDIYPTVPNIPPANLADRPSIPPPPWAPTSTPTNGNANGEPPSNPPPQRRHKRAREKIDTDEDILSRLRSDLLHQMVEDPSVPRATYQALRDWQSWHDLYELRALSLTEQTAKERGGWARLNFNEFKDILKLRDEAWLAEKAELEIQGRRSNTFVLDRNQGASYPTPSTQVAEATRKREQEAERMEQYLGSWIELCIP
jgi:hypothetical protein